MRFHKLSAFVALVVLAASACSDGGGSDDEAAGDDDGFEPCAYISAEEVSEVTGLAVIEDQEVSTTSVCSFIVDSGPTGVSLQVNSTPTRVEFDALVPADMETTAVAIDAADEALAWTSTDTFQEGLVRVGGTTARVTIVWDEPPEDYSALASLMTTVAGSLPEEEFADGEAPGALTCVSISLDELRDALSLPDLQAAPAGSSTACAVSDAASGVNLLIDLPAGEAGQEQLNLDGRTSEIDGETYEWVVEAVSGVGDGALWTLDPVSERSGELVALFGDQLVRVTSSANEPGEDLKLRAVAAAMVAAAGANAG